MGRGPALITSEPKQRLTVAEYLALERQSATRHDFWQGEAFARTGSNRQHNLICGNIAAALHGHFASRPGEVYANQMRVRTPTDLFTYPDVVAVPGEPRFEDREFDTLLNPGLIVEILSKSTEFSDRLIKLDQYRAAQSITEIVLVAQDRVRLEHWIRQGDSRWLLETLDDLGQMLDLPSIGCRLPVALIYGRVFPQQ